MVCDVYYDNHPPFEGVGDRCSLNEIAAVTARQFSFLAMSTSICGTVTEICPYPSLWLSLTRSSATRHAKPLHHWQGRQKIRAALCTHPPDSHPGAQSGPPSFRRHCGRGSRYAVHPIYTASHHSWRAQWLYVIYFPSSYPYGTGGTNEQLQSRGKHHC